MTSTDVNDSSDSGEEDGAVGSMFHTAVEGHFPLSISGTRLRATPDLRDAVLSHLYAKYRKFWQCSLKIDSNYVLKGTSEYCGELKCGCGTLVRLEGAVTQNNEESSINNVIAIVTMGAGHPKGTIKRQQLRGRRREVWKEQLTMLKPYSMWHNAIHANGGDGPMVPSKDVIRKAKSEGFRTEINPTFQILGIEEESMFFWGGRFCVYVMDYQMISQVVDWEDVHLFLNVIGSVCAKADVINAGSDGDVFLYTALAKSGPKKVPLSHMFTVCPDSLSVKCWLSQLFAALHRQKKGFRVTAFCTDMCPSMMIGVLESVIVCRLHIYLRKLYKVCSGHASWPVETPVLKLCRQNIRRNVRRHISHLNQLLQQNILVFFEQLLDATTYAAFCHLLAEFLTVVSRKYICSCVENAEKILRGDSEEVLVEDEDTDEDDMVQLPPDDDDEKEMDKIVQFGVDAQRIHEQVQSSCTCVILSNVANPLYSPDTATQVVQDAAYSPMWSSFFFQPPLSNADVKSYHKVVKSSILNQQVNLPLAEVIYRLVTWQRKDAASFLTQVQCKKRRQSPPAELCTEGTEETQCEQIHKKMKPVSQCPPQHAPSCE